MRVQTSLSPEAFRRKVLPRVSVDEVQVKNAVSHAYIADLGTRRRAQAERWPRRRGGLPYTGQQRRDCENAAILLMAQTSWCTGTRTVNSMPQQAPMEMIDGLCCERPGRVHFYAG